MLLKALKGAKSVNLPTYKYYEYYEESRKSEYKSLLRQLGTDICFDDDKWICDKRIKSQSEPLNYSIIYFTTIPERYKNMAKYYAIIRIANGDTIRTIKSRVSRIKVFFEFIDQLGISFENININTAHILKNFLADSEYSISTIKDIWRETNTFTNTMNGFDRIKIKNPFAINPFVANKKLDYKYIPEYVAPQIDEAFKKDEIDLYLRCIYWLLRLIPSRISEILGMSIDCIKRYTEHWVVFIPTWKQNGGNMEPIYRSIHIEEKSTGKMLIDLLRQQQELAKKLQDALHESNRGLLFAYECVYHYKRGGKSACRYIKTATINTVEKQFKRICEQYKIKNEDGTIYYVTTHQFRHNGITDRLEAGFTLEQIADMTGHHGNAMIWNAYSHLDLKPKTIIEKQKYVLEEPKDKQNPYVLFGGRILNMEEQTEKRLLKNIRALRVPGGICGDVTGCKGDMWSCLDCEHFIPDKEQLSYFKEQAGELKNKAKRFGKYPMIRDNALKNAELFEKVVSKLIGEQ